MTEQEATQVLDEAVERGMDYLDLVAPGWFGKIARAIDAKRFDINSCSSCALALATEQLYEMATRRLDILGWRQNLLGFAGLTNADLDIGQFDPSDQDCPTPAEREMALEIPEACKVLQGGDAAYAGAGTEYVRWDALTHAWERAIRLSTRVSCCGVMR